MPVAAGGPARACASDTKSRWLRREPPPRVLLSATRKTARQLRRPSRVRTAQFPGPRWFSESHRHTTVGAQRLAVVAVGSNATTGSRARGFSPGV